MIIANVLNSLVSKVKTKIRSDYIEMPIEFVKEISSNSAYLNSVALPNG